MPLQGAIVVCYGGGREGFGGVDVGAIAGCHQFHADAQENNDEFSFLRTLHCSLH